jgi:hypothetical protein
VITEHDIDCAGLYERTRVELLDLVGSLSGEQLSRTVPATPAWCVQDVVAHLTGIAADLNANRFTEDPDAWTAAQVQSRRGRSVAELRSEWDAEAPAFEAGLRLFGYETGAHFLGDLLQHVSDVRHALGLGRIDDDDALTAALDFYLQSFHETLVDSGTGTVTVGAGDHQVALGAGATVASWRAGRFEVFRALGGRRDEAQIRAHEWTGAVDAIVPLVSRYGLPAHGLDD